ncbi:MAG: hypothetical protein ACJAYU_000569 [Bradymonadia bacterium]|jgi:hypothetical protein
MLQRHTCCTPRTTPRPNTYQLQLCSLAEPRMCGRVQPCTGRRSSGRGGVALPNRLACCVLLNGGHQAVCLSFLAPGFSMRSILSSLCALLGGSVAATTANAEDSCLALERNGVPMSDVGGDASAELDVTGSSVPFVHGDQAQSLRLAFMPPASLCAKTATTNPVPIHSCPGQSGLHAPHGH